MADEIPEFLVGDAGVQLTSSPLHTPAGGLLSAQNCEFIRDMGLGGIGSRLGMARLNGSALAGSVAHLTNLPFAYPNPLVMMVGLNAGETDSWLKTTDGSSFTAVSAAVAKKPIAVDKFTANLSVNLHPGFWFMPQRSASYKRRFYYASDDYVVWYPGIVVTATRPPLAQYDGTNSYELFRLPDNPTSPAGSYPHWIIGLWMFDGLIWMTTYDPTGTAPNLKGRVVTFDPETGTMKLIGNRFGDGTGEAGRGMPWGLASFAGKMFCVTLGISGSIPEPGGRVYSIQAGIDDTWATDRTFASDAQFGNDIIVYRGNLYVGTNGTAFLEPLVEKRTPGGTWSNSFTAPGVGQGYCGGFVEFDGNLYCCLFQSGVRCLIKKFDGSSWTTDKDIGVDYGTLIHAPGTPIIFNNDLYWPFFNSTSGVAMTNFLTKRTTGGVWTRPLTSRGLRGGLGTYRPD